MAENDRESEIEIMTAGDEDLKHRVEIARAARREAAAKGCPLCQKPIELDRGSVDFHGHPPQFATHATCGREAVKQIREPRTCKVCGKWSPRIAVYRELEIRDGALIVAEYPGECGACAFERRAQQLEAHAAELRTKAEGMRLYYAARAAKEGPTRDAKAFCARYKDPTP